MNHRSLLRVGLGGLLVAFIGCGTGLKSVEGIVTMDGKPVDGASVAFVPEGGAGRQASGSTGPDGKFTLISGPDKGAAPGNYKVLVTKKAGVSSATTSTNPADLAKMMQKGVKEVAKQKSLLPEKYAKIDTTPLTCTVPPPSQPVTFDLK